MIGRFGSAAAEVKEQLLPRVQFPISARVALAIAFALPPPPARASKRGFGSSRAVLLHVMCPAISPELRQQSPPPHLFDSVAR